MPFQAPAEDRNPPPESAPHVWRRHARSISSTRVTRERGYTVSEQQQNQQQQAQQQQQQSPTQRLGRALAEIRKVQNLMEMNMPQQGEAIAMLREAGDIVWGEIERQQQAAQQQQGQ